MQTTTTLAQEFETTPRTLRKFLRSPESGVESVGKGSRYSLPTAKREIASMKKRFDAWNAPKVEEIEVSDAEVEAPDAELDA